MIRPPRPAHGAFDAHFALICLQVSLHDRINAAFNTLAAGIATTRRLADEVPRFFTPDEGARMRAEYIDSSHREVMLAVRRQLGAA